MTDRYVMQTLAWVLAMAGIVLFMSYARADGLPQYGVSCADIAKLAAQYKIHNSLQSRNKAKIIAGNMGVSLSDTEIEQAARCLTVAGK